MGEHSATILMPENLSRRRLLGNVAAAVLADSQSRSASAAERPPNIVLIYAETVMLPI
jgi:hypothetical protein